MGCKCKDKQPKVTSGLERVPMNRLMISCGGCGVQRLLPEGLEAGAEVQLVPCPKCGVPFRGVLIDPQTVEGL